MRILIAYAGKNGTTESCVSRLKDQLTGKDVTAVCLDRDTVDPSAYDLIVLGSSVYFGRLRPSVRSFLKQHEDVMAQKRVALFLCCGLSEEYPYYQEKLFPKRVRENAFQVAFFGGSLRLEGLSLLDRMAVRAMREHLFEKSMDNGEYVADLPGILPENIDKLATHIREEIVRFYNG